MDRTNDRRRFITHGAAATFGAMAASMSHAVAAVPNAEPSQPAELEASGQGSQTPVLMDHPVRYKPGAGGPPGSASDRGKLVSGLRDPGLVSVPLTCPDLETLPWKLVDGHKEYHLRATPVRREFLPEQEMVVWGYNGSMPGPTIEATEGDRVRIVVHNDLPEPHSVHWHGFELPVEMDGVPFLTQEPIPPGDTHVYEFDLHQTGTYFYHSHFPMQESFGMVGLFVIHPKVAYQPVVDRDFGLIFQNFFIQPHQTVPDSMKMDWNWHTINGRSGPYTTPLVCKLGERVRIRLLNFSPMQHHPIHVHGHTFWLTGAGGGRIPPEAWIPANITLVGVAQASDFEFIANNPGDWLMHCHMVHHMMNHMVQQVGPRIRDGAGVEDYLTSLDRRPAVDGLTPKQAGFQVPGYPQKMQGMMKMPPSAMKKIQERREVLGMRPQWHMGVHGLMTVVRVLPDDLYERVMNGHEPVKPAETFDEIVRRARKA